MNLQSPRSFLETSIVFAVILSPGGCSKLLLLAEAGILRLVLTPTVLQECDEVIRRKAPDSRPRLAQLLDAARVETTMSPSKQQIKTAQAYVRYRPGAKVVAEAMRAKSNWFVTHDKEHFLKERGKIKLPF